MSQLMIAGNNIYSENYFNEKLITEHHVMVDLLLMRLQFIITIILYHNKEEKSMLIIKVVTTMDRWEQIATIDD